VSAMNRQRNIFYFWKDKDALKEELYFGLYSSVLYVQNVFYRFFKDTLFPNCKYETFAEKTL